jgi:hypothetical protein
MCNVCVAEAAIEVTSCKKTTCVAFEEGHRIVWRHGPNIVRPKTRTSKGKGSGSTHRRAAPPDRPTVYVRARGRSAEGRGQFQLRREHESWPKTWQTTDDLAGAMAVYGLDSKWGRHVPESVKLWATYKGPLPTLDELHDERAVRLERRQARAPRTLRPRRRLSNGRVRRHLARRSAERATSMVVRRKHG